ncbi:MAG TPA: ABC transporter permease [Alphaproteobacteria bacterium]|nr:ABC transporter permease [Alphaproteobacteria bacterium]
MQINRLPSLAPRPSAFSLRRIGAMVMRHVYVLRTSWPRLFELAYWPTLQMVLWGFINQFLATNSSWVAQASGVLIAAVILWDVLFRSQLGVSVSFLEEIWSRNLASLFVSPLRPYEMIVSLMVMSLIRTLIGIVPAALLAILLYKYSIFTLGLPLIAFFANLLIMGWAAGLMISALILRFGLGAESLAWITIFALAPVSGIYYPVSSLPSWLQPLSWILPSSHVFEGMRAVMFDHSFRLDHLAWAVGLNAVYLAIGAALFLYTFHVARKRGLLMKLGE